MPGGSLTINVDTYAQLKAVAQAVTCWAGGPAGANVRLITTSSAGPNTAVVVPESLWSIGALNLKRGGPNIVSGLVPGSNSVYNASNALAIGTNPNTCPARTNQPTISAFSVTGTTASMTYANAVGAGTVRIDWGNGVVQTGQAESGTLPQAYGRRGVFTITITDESDATQFAQTVVTI